MNLVYLAPTWFFGYDILLQAVFALITLVVALFALKIFKLTSERSVKNLGIGFFLIAISYFLEAGLNFVLLTNFEARLLTIPELSIAYLIHLIGFYGQIVFMLAGLIFILYTAAGLKKQEMLAIMLLLGVLPIFFVDDSLIFFYVISSICFLFVAMHFVRNYLAHKSKFSIAPAISFVLLLVANILLLSNLDLGSLTSDRIFYVLAHLLCFIAYLIMLVNFYMVLKK